MSEYFKLLSIISPVFVTIGIGMLARHLGLVKPAADSSLVALVVRVLYPCLIFKSVLSANVANDLGNVIWPPIVGFLSIAIGFAVTGAIAKALGFEKGSGLRTYCFSAGIYNYGFIPIPLLLSMFGDDELAVLFIHNAGVELAIWTVGVALLAKASFREAILKSFNPCVISLVLALGLNAVGINRMPGVIQSSLDSVSYCAIPLGLMTIGFSFCDFLKERVSLWEAKESLGSIFLRLGLIPAIMLIGALSLPFSIELKRVMVIEAAMPAGIMPIVIARHYGGQPVVALRIIVATTIVGIFTMPLWIRLGLSLGNL